LGRGFLRLQRVSPLRQLRAYRARYPKFPTGSFAIGQSCLDLKRA
jgi:hypothetical protein